jgi:hypothetical protein
MGNILKSILLALILAGCGSAPAFASPYFRVIGDVYSVENVAVFNPNAGIGATQDAALVNVVTHSTKDGCLLPSIVCEDWSLLSVGGAFTGPNKLALFGSQYNLEPLFQAGAYGLLNAFTPSSSLTALKSFLSTPVSSAVTLSIGAFWGVSPEQNWKGYFLLTIGPKLTF